MRRLLIVLLLLAATPAAAQIRVSQESAPGAGDFDAHVLGFIEPFVTSGTSSAYYAYDTDRPSSFNGPAPSVGFNNSALFLVQASDGLAFFAVHRGQGATNDSASFRVDLFGDTAAFLVRDDPPTSDA